LEKIDSVICKALLIPFFAYHQNKSKKAIKYAFFITSIKVGGIVFFGVLVVCKNTIL